MRVGKGHGTEGGQYEVCFQAGSHCGQLEFIV